MSSLLNEIQQKLKVPKGQYNSFSKFYYRNAEDILEAVKPLLGKGSLVISDEIVQIGDRYYVKATAWLRDGSEQQSVLNGGWTATGWAREAFDKKGMDEAQITGAASSYARKYALNGLFCIDDTKDADHDEAPKAPERPLNASRKPLTLKNEESDEQQIKAAKDRIAALLKQAGYNPKTAKDYGDAVFELTTMSLDMAASAQDYHEIAEAIIKAVSKK